MNAARGRAVSDGPRGTGEPARPTLSDRVETLPKEEAPRSIDAAPGGAISDGPPGARDPARSHGAEGELEPARPTRIDSAETPSMKEAPARIDSAPGRPVSDAPPGMGEPMRPRAAGDHWETARPRVDNRVEPASWNETTFPGRATREDGMSDGSPGSASPVRSRDDATDMEPSRIRPRMGRRVETTSWSEGAPDHPAGDGSIRTDDMAGPFTGDEGRETARSLVRGIPGLDRASAPGPGTRAERTWEEKDANRGSAGAADADPGFPRTRTAPVIGGMDRPGRLETTAGSEFDEPVLPAASGRRPGPGAMEDDRGGRGLPTWEPALSREPTNAPRRAEATTDETSGRRAGRDWTESTPPGRTPRILPLTSHEGLNEADGGASDSLPTRKGPGKRAGNPIPSSETPSTGAGIPPGAESALSPRLDDRRRHGTLVEASTLVDAPSPRRIHPASAGHPTPGGIPTERGWTAPRAAPSAPDVVRVTIGSVEVRAVTPPAPNVERVDRTRRPGPALSLDNYLKQRNEGLK